MVTYWSKDRCKFEKRYLKFQVIKKLNIKECWTVVAQYK